MVGLGELAGHRIARRGRTNLERQNAVTVRIRRRGFPTE